MDEINDSNATDHEDLLQKHLKQIIGEENLDLQRKQIQLTANRLNVNLLDCAAALLFLNQPIFLPQLKPPGKLNIEPLGTPYRFVRYRLDVGSQHNVGKEQIQAILIEESGVDKKRIGRIDIRHNYTLVELPDGMPADIFQLLSEAVIGERKLAIKRVKPNRRGLRGG